jgi:hypothetical protein
MRPLTRIGAAFLVLALAGASPAVIRATDPSAPPARSEGASSQPDGTDPAPPVAEDPAAGALAGQPTGDEPVPPAIQEKGKPQPPNAHPDLKGRPTQVSGPAEREAGIDGADRPGGRTDEGGIDGRDGKGGRTD